MASVMSLRCSSFTNMYYKWIGNIEGTRCALLIKLSGSRGYKGRKQAKIRQKGVKNTKSSIMTPIMSLGCSNFTDMYYKWIGNIEGTRCSLIMVLFGFRVP